MKKPSVKSLGKAVVERDGPGFLLMLPNGDMSSHPTRKAVEAAVKQWQASETGANDIAVVAIEWRGL